MANQIATHEETKATRTIKQTTIKMAHCNPTSTPWNASLSSGMLSKIGMLIISFLFKQHINYQRYKSKNQGTNLMIIEKSASKNDKIIIYSAILVTRLHKEIRE